jgi:hypothetical protein
VPHSIRSDEIVRQKICISPHDWGLSQRQQSCSEEGYAGFAYYRMCEYLPDALREYSLRWQQALNKTAEETFAAIYEDPMCLRRFTQFIVSYSILQGEEIARRLDFTPYRCLMDLAGGREVSRSRSGVTTRTSIASSWTYRWYPRSPRSGLLPPA